ncbi:MAG: GNAT family N-acetyltransferase [Alphaproteobacteria bacterium]|jgi:ribosomal-protein-alanine N-acetyltransferase|nr:GNAT family N-acetyltransferase [Alphaproteobacteria bacterium]
MLVQRKLTPHDAPACAALHGPCFPKAWRQDEFISLLSSPQIWAEGLFCQEDLVAALMVNRVQENADIITLMTHADYRRKRLAYGLLETFLEGFFATKGESCFLEVSTNNKKAISLYKSLNFSKCGLRKEYYTKLGKNEDALVMRATSFQKKQKM